jgi:hypothetical protein
MREINLVQGPFVEAHIHLEPRILDRVGGEMLDRRDHIMGLDACPQRCPHQAEMHRVLPIGLLRPPPGWMAQQVDAHRAR